MGGGQIGIHPTGLQEQGLYGRPPLLGGVAKDAEENTGAITRGVVELDGVTLMEMVIITAVAAKYLQTPAPLIPIGRPLIEQPGGMVVDVEVDTAADQLQRVNIDGRRHPFPTGFVIATATTATNSVKGPY